jgi:hypothetical protein
MGEIIALLDGYFCSPRHNFDWKHAGVSPQLVKRGPEVNLDKLSRIT